MRLRYSLSHPLPEAKSQSGEGMFCESLRTVSVSCGLEARDPGCGLNVRAPMALVMFRSYSYSQLVSSPPSPSSASGWAGGRSARRFNTVASMKPPPPTPSSGARGGGTNPCSLLPTPCGFNGIFPSFNTCKEKKRNEVHETAKGYAVAGCNCIPVDPKTKKPKVAWARWQSETISDIERTAMFERAEGIAVVCGQVSGGLEVIDFDDPAVFPFWCSLINEDLYKRLLVQRTQSGGFHACYRCERIGRNQRLAVQGEKTVIETRGEGGYAIIAPTPGYEVIQGAWAQLPIVSPEERNQLIATARAFDSEGRGSRVEGQGSEQHQSLNSKPSTLRPTDAFLQRTSWSEILGPHGWKQGPTKNGETSWYRPGKDPNEGHSAVSNHFGDDRLRVFSSNAHPLKPERSYNKLQVHCILDHGDNWREMMRSLEVRGFGNNQSGQNRTKPHKPEREALYPSIDIGAIEPIEEVEFWWRPYLPKGKAVLLDGDSGTRKTTLVLSLAAAFSNGIDPVTTEKIPTARTLYFGKEDTPQELGTVFQANEGKTGFMEVYPDTFSLTPKAIDDLHKKIEQEGWNIIVFDAYLYFLEGIVRDSNNSVQEIKKVTQALGDVYEATGASGIHIRHTAKMSVGRTAAAMGVGSYQFRASHRGQLLVRRHPERGRDIVVADCKGNLLVEQGAMFGVERLGNEMRYYPLDGDPFAEEPHGEKPHHPAHNAAVEFLKKNIRGGEQVYASELYEKASKKGISDSSLRKATKAVGIEVRRDGRRWIWYMPDPFSDRYCANSQEQ